MEANSTRMYQLFCYLTNGNLAKGVGIPGHGLPTELERKKDSCLTTLWFHSETNRFKIVIEAWHISHHNGDPYSHSHRKLEIGENGITGDFLEGKWGEEIDETLKQIESFLEEKALEKAKEEYEEAQRELQDKQIRNYLNAKLINSDFTPKGFL